MDLAAARTELETAVSSQMALSGADEAVETAVEAILSVLGATIERIAYGLAEQAAVEVAAQLPGHSVDVVIRDGEPSLLVQADENVRDFTKRDLVARLTVRLPEELKEELENAADQLGDSLNSLVIQRLASASDTTRKARGGRFTGTVET